ncbi:MAG TPA: T9SS type A sorting domain-containing protein, partial [Bacteroidia bacterium]|nr:T9SS type A sorting domain-containing protein [Bacteroidia bacterium]
VTIDTTLCSLDAPYLLTEGNPAGGVWSGTSISGNTFDPVAAGVGSYVLTYTYTASTGCSASASDTIIVDACSGIDEHTNAAVWSAYPNPAFGDVTISTPENQTGKMLVEVYSAEGKLISSENYDSTNLIHLNFSDRAVGMYLVRITTTKETSTIHVFKQ